ncbi:MAG TPA: tetraacyldisaccharide 4'-kinase [Planctomycetaceae bacterium]|nr:tetraacyldisaccharide 4'-kinase [Planctomycetaceae bacterium]
MDEQTLLAILSGERRGVIVAALRSACAVASWGYATAIALRNAAFDHGWRRIHRVDAPVISVGNLTTGGTGKTPVVAWLANELTRHGHRPAIVSRGYRSLDGLENDEARVLARLCPAAIRIQNRDRVAGATTAIQQHGCDAIILDDGFQHRRLHRDLDVVLIDALQPWGYGRLLPRGLLREPVTALRRADVVVITRADQVTAEQLADLRLELIHCGAPPRIAAVQFAPQRLIRTDGRTEPLSALEGQRVAAFCGLGNPRGFLQTVSPWNPVAEPRLFADHHHYTPTDFAALEQWRQTIGADVLLTTLKDLVKWPPGDPLGDHVRAIDIGVEFLTGRERVEELLAGTLSHRTERRAA